MYHREQLLAHPHYPELLETIRAYFTRPKEKLGESPERMVQTIDYAAQLEFLTGEPLHREARTILRRTRDEWPLPFENFNHQLTIQHIRTMVRAAKLSPACRAELAYPLRWCEWRMLAPQAPNQAPTAIHSTNVVVGLLAVTMIRDILYGRHVATATALDGFGPETTQWGLLRIIDDWIDAEGNPNWHVGREGHQASTTRVAFVHLLYRFNVWNHLSAEQRKKARAYYLRPLRLLCVGAQSFNNAFTAALPSLNDEYATNPMLGPPTAWTLDTAADRWARSITRKQGWGLSVDDLLLPVDEGYVAPERPRIGRGNRTVGPYAITETATETTITYTPTGRKEINGKAERIQFPVTAKVSKPGPKGTNDAP